MVFRTPVQALGVALLACLFMPGPARAAIETATVSAPLEEQRLTGIDLEAPPREIKQALLDACGLTVGQPFRAEAIRRAVKVLYQLGRFDNVMVFAQPEDAGVALKLVLSPRPFVREVTVKSSGEATSAELEAAAGFKVGDELVLSSLPVRRKAVQDLLERRGHRSSAIGLAVQRTDANGGAEVLIRVDEGPKTRLRNIVVRGRPKRPLWSIAERIRLVPGDVIELDRLEAGLASLEQEYRDQGRFEVRVAAPEVREVQGQTAIPWADVVLDIDAGPSVQVRFKGAQVVPARELEEASSVLEELGIGRGALAEARERILTSYERRGHWQAKVEPAVRVTPDREKAEVLFSIQEGPAARVDGLEFPGNTALETDRLEEVVIRSIQDALGEELGRPAPDAAVITEIFSPPSVKPREARPSPHPPDPDPSHLYMERAYRAAADAVADLYRAEGFPSVEVSAPEVLVSDDGKRLTVRIPVRQGVRWMAASVRFAGNRAVPTSELEEVAALEPGTPLSFYQVESSRRAVLSHYRDQGYLYARVDEELQDALPQEGLEHPTGVRTSSAAALDVREVCSRVVEGQQDRCDVGLTFAIREGPRVRTRQLIIRGAEGTERSLVERELTLVSGGVLRESDLAETQRNLLRLGIYQRVTVRPIDEDQEAPEKDILVEVHEGKHHSFEIGGGASTGEGVRVFATYGHSNFANSAIRFQLNGKLNVQPFIFLYDEKIRDSVARFYADRPLEYLVAAGFVYPRILGLPRGFRGGLDLAALRDNDPSFSQDSRTLSVALDYDGFRPRLFGDERRVTLQLRASFDWADLTCNPDLEVRRGSLCGAASDDPARRFEGTTIYTELRPSASWDFRDDPLNPRAGVQLELQPAILFGFNTKSPPHANLRARINGYIPIFTRSTIAVSFVFWEIFPFEADGEPIPVNRRFFAGGRSTIRGYPEETLLPRDVETPPSGLSPGGLMMVALKTEVRFPLADGLDGTLFYDVGDLFDGPGNFVIDARSRQGMGFGIRYATPIGPLLLDIAFPLVRRGQDLAWVPHFAAVGSF